MYHRQLECCLLMASEVLLVVCYDRLDALLRVLCESQVSIDLHDIYYESLMMHPSEFIFSCTLT
ncbi:hypothetical protein BDL97_08G103700 [Sphagnum fallax]|jgi:hypothetical protein|nr:hypothetical protein BDL97_08G103700 [Sphagnum fallax]